MKGNQIMVDLTLSGSPREFSKELKERLSKNCENIFRYIFDEIIPNIKNSVRIDFDWRYMGDKQDYYARYGGCFYMELYPKTKCSGNNYFEFNAKYHDYYAYSVFKKLKVEIDKKWFEHERKCFRGDFEAAFCADFFEEYGLQLQLMEYWPKVKKQLLDAIERDKKLTAEIQNSINSFEL
jgi:hypothetical protein